MRGGAGGPTGSLAGDEGSSARGGASSRRAASSLIIARRDVIVSPARRASVAWAPADVPLLEAVRQVLLTGEPPLSPPDRAD